MAVAVSREVVLRGLLVCTLSRYWLPVGTADPGTPGPVAPVNLYSMRCIVAPFVTRDTGNKKGRQWYEQ